MNRRALIDAAERTLATAAETFLAAVAIGSIADVKSAELAGIAAGIAAAKYALVVVNTYLGNPPGAPSSTSSSN